jgi:hypothetical protein
MLTIINGAQALQCHLSVPRVRVILRFITPYICCPPPLAVGVTWQRSSCIDGHGSSLLCDAYGAPLTFSGQSSDSSIMGLASMVYRCVKVFV